MEDFAKELENYLDENEINAKKKLDELEEEKSTSKNSVKYKFDNTITIREFVNNYLGANHSCDNLKHQGLKSFKNPYVIGIPNDFAMKNPDSIMRREILVVIDSFGNPGTYLNPKLLKDFEKMFVEMKEYKDLLKLLQKVRITNLDNLQELYKEFTLVSDKISELEKQYIDGLDLLTIMERENILKRIKRTVLKGYDKRQEYYDKELDIEHSFLIEDSILNKLEEEKQNDKYKRR